MKSVVPVCYITDENYILPTIVSISSLLETRGKGTTYHVHLITTFALGKEGLMIDELRRKHPECTITILRSEQIGDARLENRKNHVSKVALLKYVLCDLLPTIDKAIYIDGDTVIQKDLTELYRINLGDNYLGAATALIGYNQKYHDWQYESLVGVPFGEYINTGVMVMNFAALRRDAVAAKLLAFTESNRKLIFMDQDAFNAVCKGRIILLDRRYNLMPECATAPSSAMREAASRPEEAVILHFAGKKKPWNTFAARWSRHYAGYYHRSPARGEFFRTLGRYGKRELRKKALRPFRRIRNFVEGELREASQRYRVFDTIERRKDEDAFAAQYFYLDQMVRATNFGLNRGDERERSVTVSLTTIPSRIYEIGTTIESILMQSFKPDRIVLWLDRDGITESELPLSLRGQMERGLTVRFCEDIGPHTKLIPALKEFPDDVIITVDDDILYPNYVLERLYRDYLLDKTKIYCNRARFISVLNRNDFRYEQDWKNVSTEVEGLNLLPLGVGGVLYPPGVLGDDVFDLALQKELAPRADDIWFKAMSLKRGVVCKRIAGMRHIFPMRPHSQEVGLQLTNVKAGGNETQISACFDHFDLWNILGANRLP